jgi:hypothetical protein
MHSFISILSEVDIIVFTINIGYILAVSSYFALIFLEFVCSYCESNDVGWHNSRNNKKYGLPRIRENEILVMIVVVLFCVDVDAVVAVRRPLKSLIHYS